MLTQWKDINIFKAYELALTGMSNTAIAGALGVSKQTLINWKRSKPLVRLALRRARRIRTNNNGEELTLQDYIFRCLPDDLKTLWEEINSLRQANNGIERIEALLTQHGTRARQYLFLHALFHSNFNKSQACRKVNISKNTFMNWCNNDPQFGRLIEEVIWHEGNFFESCLCRLVSAGDTAATIFANRTFNRDRGFNDKTEIDVNQNTTMTHAFTVKIEDLDLEPKITQAIFEAMRRRKAVESRVLEKGSDLSE